MSELCIIPVGTASPSLSNSPRSRRESLFSAWTNSRRRRPQQQRPQKNRRAAGPYEATVEGEETVARRDLLQRSSARFHAALVRGRKVVESARQAHRLADSLECWLVQWLLRFRLAFRSKRASACSRPTLVISKVLPTYRLPEGPYHVVRNTVDHSVVGGQCRRSCEVTEYGAEIIEPLPNVE